ncbi:glutathione-S-transferas-like protein omega 1 [Aaosphaeria arxii CBS 175.79]|uniref:Glutathione-S-transferas-like protein omega 1 n=1 Tax=Aaosphaeria arxii CBS 175.79 TaxID=1450172 RepID=A0A6A5Y613_9PLEO|nr:glutathione-S-transferas-like protein omega 1 [Aaosphaeria arxii CBS 175.79]KAF2020726.1 glutathione-S-transferas-like protein omega 1 [Aaosphaeria arxii CBS 175.79]
MAAVSGEAPKITLYTNHRCPWAHRAHIVIKELGLPYEESIIDLDRPRDPWYLEVNPRGLVPSIKYSSDSVKDEIITESGVVAQFLADAHPSHLVPSTGDPKASLARARIQFFVETWFSKANSFWFQILTKDTQEEKEELSKQLVAAVEKEIEPLLKDAKPFFGGSERLTLAEALTAPFVLRIYALAKHDIIPKSTLSSFEALPNFSKWAAEVIKHDSVTYIWDEEKVIAGTQARIAKLKAQAK